MIIIILKLQVLCYCMLHSIKRFWGFFLNAVITLDVCIMCTRMEFHNLGAAEKKIYPQDDLRFLDWLRVVHCLMKIRLYEDFCLMLISLLIQYIQGLGHVQLWGWKKNNKWAYSIIMKKGKKHSNKEKDAIINEGKNDRNLIINLV